MVDRKGQVGERNNKMLRSNYGVANSNNIKTDQRNREEKNWAAGHAPVENRRETGEE